MEFARQASYDLILLDLMLPGRNGLEVLRSMRAGGQTAPVMVLTAVAAWLSQVKPGMRTTTMRVSVLDEGGAEIAAWSYGSVYPVRWTGPTLDVAQSSAATETLELAHGGFLAGGL